MSGDANYANVVLLAHFDGANGSTSFADEKLHPLSPSSGVQISTAQSKFGGSSALFAGAGQYLTSPNNADFNFGSGDFTIEFWIRQTSTTGSQAIITYANGSAQNSNYAFQMLINNGVPSFSVFNGNTQYAATSPSTLPFGSFAHVAVSRASGTMRLFVNGVQVASVSANVTLNNPSGAVLYIGQAVGFYPLNAYIDEMRVTKGVARYTAAFTAPVGPFPDGIAANLAGVTLDSSGNPVSRLVRSFRRSDGAMIDSVVSDSVTGSFSVRAADLTEHFVVAFDDAKNAEIYDHVTPIS